jgi:hypothetical protein
MKKMIVLCLIVAGLYTNVLAQEKDTKSANQTTPKSGVERLDHRHALWIDLLSGPSGFVSMGYERALTDQISAEVSLGLTFNPSFDPNFHDILMNVLAPNFVRTSTQYWADKGYSTPQNSAPFMRDRYSLVNNSNATPVVGAYVSTSARFFLDDEVFDGFYVSPRLQFMSFNYNHRLPIAGLSNTSDETFSKATMLISKSYFDVIPSIGWHFGDDRVKWSYEIGVGARLLNVHTFDSGYKPQGNGQYLHEVRRFDATTVIPMLSSQFKMGITL